VIVAMVLVSGAARAGSMTPWVDPTKPEVKFVPPGRLMIVASGSTQFWGGLTYSEEGTGLTASDSTVTTGSGKVVVGVEVYEGIELGAAVRYAPSIKFEGETWSDRELDLFGRIGIHGRPWKQLDVSFAIDAGHSHIYQSAGSTLPDPTGFVIDFSGAAMYPLGASFYGVAGLGYQRGFQTTTSEHIPGQPQPTTYNTDFMHFDLGIGYRFL
jgi:hypothetical protein